MSRILTIFFAPLLRPLRALFILCYSLLCVIPGMSVVLSWFCYLKAAIYGATSCLSVVAAFTMQQATSSTVSLETGQIYTLGVAYVMGALAVAHYQVAEHFSSLR